MACGMRVVLPIRLSQRCGAECAGKATSLRICRYLRVSYYQLDCVNFALMLLIRRVLLCPMIQWRSRALQWPGRWYIEAPGFMFGSTDQGSNYDSVESFGGSARSRPPGPQLPSGPEDDPADFFEYPPRPVVIPTVSAPASSDAADVPARSAAGEAAQPAEEIPPPQLRIANGSTARSISRPAPSDPLAVMRVLSEEELIALFG